VAAVSAEDAAAAEEEVVAAATTVIKMATLLANALSRERDEAAEAVVDMEVAEEVTAIRQGNKSTRDSNDQKRKKKKTKHESPRSFPAKPTFWFVSDAVSISTTIIKCVYCSIKVLVAAIVAITFHLPLKKSK